jgi:hypothetical protein
MPGGRQARFLSPVAWAFVIALAVRVLLPGGVMPVTGDAGQPTVVLCTGAGPVEAVIDGGRLTPVKHAPVRNGPNTAHEHGACPFAGGLAYVPPPVVPQPAPVAAARQDVDPTSPAAREAALRLRAPPPPSHAPPLRLV